MVNAVALSRWASLNILASLKKVRYGGVVLTARIRPMNSTSMVNTQEASARSRPTSFSALELGIKPAYLPPVSNNDLSEQKETIGYSKPFWTVFAACKYWAILWMYSNR